VGVDGCGAVNHLTCLLVVIERLAHEVDLLSEGLATALLEHEIVQQIKRASK
jgi:hypothetical protein